MVYIQPTKFTQINECMVSKQMSDMALRIGHKYISLADRETKDAAHAAVAALNKFITLHNKFFKLDEVDNG